MFDDVCVVAVVGVEDRGGGGGGDTEPTSAIDECVNF